MRPRRTPAPERLAAEARGRAAERWAGWWLRCKGWTILDRRVRCKAGEVDIVAGRPGLVAFVEVKARGRGADLDWAIDERRLTRVAAAAELLAPRYAAAGEDIRIDVILIAPGRRLQHLENVWLG